MRGDVGRLISLLEELPLAVRLFLRPKQGQLGAKEAGAVVYFLGVQEQGQCS